MKIALLSTPFLSVPPHSYGGTELVVYELAEELVARGHEVTVFSTGDSRTSARVRYLYPKPQWPPSALPDLNHVTWAMAEVVADGNFDIVHAHSAFALPFVRFFPDLPLIYTIHHARDEELSRFYRNFPDVAYVAISENQRQIEIPLRHCDVIHHGLDPGRYRWTERAEDHVCFLGRFARIKGPHVAIDAAERAGVRIHVAGEIHSVDVDFGKEEVMPRLGKPHVDFLGCLGDAGKVPLLTSSRALLASIDWEEPFGLFMIEAMLSGCPVVAFPRGSVPELVEPGVTGFIVSSFEEMVETIRPGGVLDGFDRRRCREQAVRRFSRARMVDRHEALYSKLLGEAVPRIREPLEPQLL